MDSVSEAGNDTLQLITSEGFDGRLELIKVWVSSCNWSDAAAVREFKYVITHESELVAGLSKNDRDSFVEAMRLLGASVPFSHRILFTLFGQKLVEISTPAIAPPRYSDPVKPSTSSSSDDSIRAHAILEIRGIVLGATKKRSSFIPFGWSYRYGKILGSYDLFVRSLSPDLFTVEESPDSDHQIIVGIANSFTDQLVSGFRLTSSACPKPSLDPDALVPEDPQYEQLSVIPADRRASLAGSRAILDRAAGVVQSTIARHPLGCSCTVVQQAITDAGIPPLPIAWFEDVGIETRLHSVYMRRGFSTGRPLPAHPSVDSWVMRLCAKSKSISCTIGEISQASKLTTDQVMGAVRQSESLFCEPGKFFSCARFEEIVEGYMSPESVRNAEATAQLSTMSPIRHLLNLVKSCVQQSTAKSIPSKILMAWCAALDVKPRTIWQCLRDDVFWSSPLVDLQILLRTPRGTTEHPSCGQDAPIPPELLQEVKVAITKLGARCTLDKLAIALHWSKESANRKKYGLLKDVLRSLPQVFYEPEEVFSKRSLDGKVVWPDGMDKATPQDTENFETEYLRLAHFSASIAHHLSNTPSGSCSIEDAVTFAQSYGLTEPDLGRLRTLFTPGAIVYLRKDVSTIPEKGSIEELVVKSLKLSKFGGLSLQKLIAFAQAKGMWSRDELRRFQSDLEHHCGEVDGPTEVLPTLFYNPRIIFHETAATTALDLRLPANERPKIVDVSAEDDD